MSNVNPPPKTIRGLQPRAGSPAVRLTSYVPPALALALRHAAIDRGETSSDIVRRALAAYLGVEGSTEADL